MLHAFDVGLDFARLPAGGAAAQFVAFGEVGAVLLVFGIGPVPNGGAAHAVNGGYVFYCDELLLHKKTPLLFVEHGKIIAALTGRPKGMKFKIIYAHIKSKMIYVGIFFGTIYAGANLQEKAVVGIF